MSTSNNFRRYNPLLDQWVIVAANRVNRPWQGATTGDGSSGFQKVEGTNQLAPGGIRANGQITPMYTSTYAFDNDFPSFTHFENGPNKTMDDDETGLFRQQEIRGICRVICYHPNTEKTMATMDKDEVFQVVKLWMDQFNELKEKYTWVQIFENRGAAVGCSNSHPHGQIWAGDFLPSLPQRKEDNQKSYFEKNERPMLCDYLERELALKERIVIHNEHWTVLVPFWAFWPFETLLLPNRHVSRMDELTEEEQVSLAVILRELNIKYDNIFKCTFPYSMGWSGAPSGSSQASEQRHWQLHAAFHPPLLRSASVPKYMAGYEVFAEAQRDITPEAAAEIIRNQPDVRFNMDI